MKKYKKTIFFFAILTLLFATVLPANAATHKYDSLGRLIETTYDSGKAVTYSYDALGNMTAVRDSAPQISNIPSFTDGSGNPVDSLSSETLVTTLAYQNESDKAESLTMYVAVYSPDGRLKYVGADSKEIAPNQTVNFKSTLHMPENADGNFASNNYFAHVFLWDSETFVPVLPKYTFK